MPINKTKTPGRLFKVIAFGLLILISIPVLINLAFGDHEQFESFSKFFDNVAYGFTVGFVFWVGNWAISANTGRRLNWRKNPAKANIISMLSFLSYGILASLLVPFLFAKFIWHVEESRLVSNVVSQAFIAISIDIIIISFYYSRYLVAYWGESIKNEEELKRENLIARYEALKNQVNPHFLFNTLNTLTGVVEQHPEKAVEFIRKLADIYRYVLEQKDKELSTIEDELKFVTDFIYLAKMRHGEGLIVNNNIDEWKVKIAPLGLQMLIENAIKHNIISDQKPLTIEMGIADNYIFVRNNLQRKSTVQNTSAIGLENLVKRYEYLCDRAVIINETGSVFEVKLPVLESEKV